jgi:flagellar hook-basal body complex protein FliE
MAPYVVTANDIENVLQQYSLRVSDTQGKSFETMAAELVDELDLTPVVEAASKADTTDAQGQAVFNALHQLLVKEGILEF